ncbi:efflux RND transporter periplasmic adaptor subunit [Natronospirillum operosum]|uniref:Efflux RND transporter periplasmic adaptor subunit n=1 Tax=Natronospirillum operosum TaxID=2759953 RepID=A0A4Z0WCN2_9GAMM|nr:efflux RND transporter periplasmic adaptor subunit [Natronospirillum operosum]TGG94245.1 efflux RND transporter periplasmic adaptor subunit [Natronospirillum operosum]
MAVWKQATITLFILLLGAGGWLWWHPGAADWRAQMGFAQASEGSGQGGGGPGFGGTASVIGAEVVEGQRSDRLTAIGDGEALRSVMVTPEVGGRVATIERRSGDLVSTGDVIARLDDASERIALDRAELAVRDAETRLNRLQRMQSASSVTEAEVNEAESALDNARLQRREAELALERRTILAPLTGVLGNLSIEPGSFISQQSEITRIDDRSELLVEFRVPERYVGQLEVGTAIRVNALSAADRDLEGTISELDSRLETDSRTLRVRARIPNEDDRLRPGMSFNIHLDFPGETYPAVDPLAIQWSSDGAFVWRIDSEDQVQRVPVRIVQRDSNQVLVEADLQIGDTVVIEGVQALRPGAQVQLVDAPTEAPQEG